MAIKIAAHPHDRRQIPFNYIDERCQPALEFPGIFRDPWLGDSGHPVGLDRRHSATGQCAGNSILRPA